jgi:hypothetical protein
VGLRGRWGLKWLGNISAVLEARVKEHSDKLLEVVKRDLSLLEKQVRMLSELADTAPGIDRTQERGKREDESEFVVVHRQRIYEIVEQMKSQLGLIRFGLEASLGERDTPLLDAMIKDL